MAGSRRTWNRQNVLPHAVVVMGLLLCGGAACHFGSGKQSGLALSRPSEEAAGESEGVEVATPEILIKVREDSKALEAARSIGGVSASKLGPAGWYGVVLQQGVSVEEALERARAQPRIVTAEPNYTAEIQSAPMP